MGVHGTGVNGISGSNIVGYYYDSSDNYHGFLYDGSTYVTLDDPLGTMDTTATGISGNKIVGYYEDSSFITHGFVTSVPEPSFRVLLGIGAVSLLAYAWRRPRQAA